jgi:hypothetical protein
MSDYDASEQADQLIADALAWRQHRQQEEANQRASEAANRAVDADRSKLFENAGLVDPSADPDAGRHPGELGLQRFHEAVRGGRRHEDAAAHVINRLIDAANKGDARVLDCSAERDRDVRL